MSSVVEFPAGNKKDQVGASKESEMPEVDVGSVIQGFIDKKDSLEEVLIIGISKSGSITWGSSSDDLRSILWIAKAMERIAMDISLGISPEDN